MPSGNFFFLQEIYLLCRIIFQHKAEMLEVNLKMNIDIDIEARGPKLIVRLNGELDHHTAELFRSRVQEVLARGKTKKIILNLSGLNFMDSSGIGVILGRYNFLKHKGGSIAVCNLQPQVKKVFYTAGLFNIFNEYGSEKEAIDNI